MNGTNSLGLNSQKIHKMVPKLSIVIEWKIGKKNCETVAIKIFCLHYLWKLMHHECHYVGLIHNISILYEFDFKKDRIFSKIQIFCSKIFSTDVIQTWNQSHYREVPRWEIFMQQELRFGLVLARLVLLKKNWVNYEQLLRPVFSCFHGQKKIWKWYSKSL